MTVQKEMKESSIKEVDKMHAERVEEFVAWKGTTLESRKTFGRKRDEEMRQAKLRTTESDSANARNREVLAALRCIAKAREE